MVGRINVLVSLEEEDVESSGNDLWTIEDLKRRVVLSNKNMTAVQKEEVYGLLFKVNSALSWDDGDIGKAKVKGHYIELTNNTPIWQKSRNFAEPVNQEIENQCQELLASDIIEYSDSRWSSPCVPVRKTDGSLRFCIDYRKVNNLTRTEQFPMPDVNSCLYRAHNIQYFTKVDLVRGYYQVHVDEGSRDVTSFSTTRNRYRFKRLPFGLKNAGVAFQRTMQQILSGFGTQ